MFFDFEGVILFQLHRKGFRVNTFLQQIAFKGLEGDGCASDRSPATAFTTTRDLLVSATQTPSSPRLYLKLTHGFMVADIKPLLSL